MHSRHFWIIALSLSVLSGVSCKEQETPADTSDYLDSTVPLDVKVPDADVPAIISYNNTQNTDPTTSSPGLVRASGTDSSVSGTGEDAGVETPTTAAPGEVGGTKVGQEQATNTTLRRKHKIIDPISVKLLRGEGNGISVTDVALPEPIVFFKFKERVNTYSVDYHYAKNLIFYFSLNTIFRDEVVGRLTRTGAQKVVASAGMDGKVRLAVDWVHDKLYWLSEKHQVVEMADLNGSNRTLLFDNFRGTRFPNNIAIDPYAGYLFLVSNYSIFRADLDGANSTRLQLEGEDNRGVKCLSLDIHKRRIYYSGKTGDNEKGKPYIASCDYEGEGVKVHALEKRWNDIFAVDVFRDMLYFTHYISGQQDELWRVDLTTNPLSPVLLHTADPSSGGIYSLRVYHPGVQEAPDGKQCQEANKKEISEA